MEGLCRARKGGGRTLCDHERGGAGEVGHCDPARQIRDQTFPDDEAPELDDAEYLVNYVGKIGYLQLGFAHQGVMFVFEVATDWYDRFQDLLETVSELGGIVLDDGDNDE